MSGKPVPEIIRRAAIIDHLVASFRTAYGLTDDDLTADELAEAERRVQERFGTRDWTSVLP